MTNDNDNDIDSHTINVHIIHDCVNPHTGERVNESSIVTDGQRIYWCGHTEDA